MVKSYEARVAKPDKKIFDIAAKEFGINPEKTLFIDDSPYNIAVAKELGWQGVEVKPGSDSPSALPRLRPTMPSRCASRRLCHFYDV